MLKLLIVDDESIVRRGIRTSIRWEDYGIEIAGEAAGGREALDLLSEDINIILTDIKMPEMSGIELSEIIKKKYKHMEIVVLSAYEDFQYAKEAIKIGVKEYLLKPVNVDHLISVMSRIKQELENKENQEQNYLHQSQIIQENLLHIKSAFFRGLIHQEYTVEQIAEKALFYDLPLKGPNYQVFVITLDNFHYITENMTAKERDSLKFASQNIAEEILNAQYTGFVCYGESNQIVGVVNVDSHLEIEGMCEEIKHYICHYIKFKVSIGIGMRKKQLRELQASYKEAMAANEHKVFDGQGNIYKASDLLPPQPSSSDKAEWYVSEQKDLTRQMRADDVNRLRDMFNRFIDHYSSEVYSFKAIQSAYIQYIFAVMGSLKDLHMEVDAVFDPGFIPHVEVNKFTILPELQRWFRSKMEIVLAMLESENTHDLKKTVRSSIQYIEGHYQDHIRLTDGRIMCMYPRPTSAGYSRKRQGSRLLNG